ELGMEATITKVTDMKDIAKYGIMRTPGLVIDEKVVSYGKVASAEEITELLKK
ncbi:MAG: thioredoxin family protein, partial [Syntrophaceae bacterium]|nr:thioredoxin family protein [Syntrophaceae bacterium]